MSWNVYGHEWAEQLLKQHIARGELRHAYLFSGPPGVGRRTLALRLAQAANCPQPSAPGEPCRTCRICQQTERMQQSDLTVVQAEAAGGTLKVDQVRELQRSLMLTPYESRYRVGLLLHFENAHPSAQNALLKTLEEAPARVILLLTAESPESLLPTIVSRCEVLRLRPLPVPALQNRLQETWGVPEPEAVELAHLAGGRVGAALNFRNQPDLKKRWDGHLHTALRLLSLPLRERLQEAEKLTKDKEREALRLTYQVWLAFWRDVMLSAAGSNAPLVVKKEQANTAALALQVGLDAARQRAADLEAALGQLDDNVNPRLLTEMLLLEWPRYQSPQ